MELGFRGGTQVKAALFHTLSNPSWRVRLKVCKALINLKAVDQRVVSTLEKMTREPEAQKYDAQIERFDRIDKQNQAGTSSEAPIKTWGKIGTILQQARMMAKRHT
ncbi:hypothetical protein IAD21_00212 [Abditibacteriota bacterium]|nr:hypothetical protein IAD21_00212 [Abditibacteriota bacterium]